MNPTPGWEVVEIMNGRAFAIRGGVLRHYVNGSSRDQILVVCPVDPDNGGPEATRDNAYLAGAAPDLYAACEAQHRAIDMLLARLITLDPSFRPTQSAVFPAMVAGSEAMMKAQGRRPAGGPSS